MTIHRDTYVLTVGVDPAFDFVRGQPAYRAWEARSGLSNMARSGKPERWR
jgi:hypothetical protein